MSVSWQDRILFQKVWEALLKIINFLVKGEVTQQGLNFWASYIPIKTLSIFLKLSPCWEHKTPAGKQSDAAVSTYLVAIETTETVRVRSLTFRISYKNEQRKPAEKCSWGLSKAYLQNEQGQQQQTTGAKTWNIRKKGNRWQ